MRTITRVIELYTFDELSPKAKDKARQWWRDGFEFEPEYEPVETAARLLGITFAQRNGNSDIRWSGFSSQGDGASFVGTYEYAKGCAKAIKAEFPTDTKLHSIAERLTELQRKHAYKLTASVTQSGMYVHEYTMDVNVDGPESLQGEECRNVEGELIGVLRDFARWIYRGLEEDYWAEQEDEQVDDTIVANEYEFTADGQRSNG